MARAFLVLLLLAVAIGCRGAEAIRAVPHGAARDEARSQSHGHRRSRGGGRGAMPRNAMPLVGTRPVPAPVRLPPAGSAEEESKRRIPSCPDPLHNR